MEEFTKCIWKEKDKISHHHFRANSYEIECLTELGVGVPSLERMGWCLHIQLGFTYMFTQEVMTESE